MFRKYVLAFIVWLSYRVLSWTWKVQVEEPDSLINALKNKEPVIFAHWHGDELVLVSLVKRYQIATITSTSKDGEMMDTVIKLLGGKTSRGSSTRGGITALKGIIRFAKEGYNTSFAVDGPKGPIYEVKPGIFELSRVIGAPIYAGGIFCDRAWVFKKAWNKTYLPKPFANIRVNWSDSIAAVPREADAHSSEYAKFLKEALQQSRTSAAQKICGA